MIVFQIEITDSKINLDSDEIMDRYFLSKIETRAI